MLSPTHASILLHSPPQPRLRLLTQLINLINNQHLKRHLLVLDEWVVLGDFFDDVLDDVAVVVAGVGGVELDVDGGGYHVYFDFAFGGGLGVGGGLGLR